ncbi:MAG TPA: hemolysin family protein [Candidatus Binatia bacterium]|jgi:putative hemolysin
MGYEIVILVLLIVACLLAMAEVAVTTARKSRLVEWVNRGSKMARVALELVEAPYRYLHAIRIGITLVCVLAGALGGRIIAEQFAAYIGVVPVIEPYSQVIAFGAAVVVIAFLLLTLGEMIPKRLAAIDPEKVAVLVALPLRALATVFWPAVRLVSVSTDALFRLFGAAPHRERPVTEEEIKTLVQKGTEAGVFEETEQDMVEAVFRLGDRTARALMTPRTRVAWLDLSDSPEQILKKISDSGHSRFPVSDGNLDNIVGVVQAKDLLARALAAEPIDLKASAQQPAFVPRTMSALHLLEFFKRTGNHIALIVDEHGGINGLLTHHDILQAIAGEIALEGSPAESKAVQRHDGSWLLDGMLSVDEFKEIFHLESLPGENRDAYQTLGGFLFTHMGRVPSVSDHFEWNDLRFEIVDMDGKRIDKVLVSPIGTNGPAGG